MRVIDPGHQYALWHLDGNLEELLTFVKREGTKYPGNSGLHPGTNIQEVLRALIDRVKYLDGQKQSIYNREVLDALRASLYWLERRAAQEHNRPCPDMGGQCENKPFCLECGHVGCTNCKALSTERKVPQ